MLLTANDTINMAHSGSNQTVLLDVLYSVLRISRILLQDSNQLISIRRCER